MRGKFQFHVYDKTTEIKKWFTVIVRMKQGGNVIYEDIAHHKTGTGDNVNFIITVLDNRWVQDEDNRLSDLSGG